MRYVPVEPDPPTESERPRRPTSPELAVLLAVLFGPLGLFYASWRGGLFMTFVCIVVGIATVGVGLLFAWPVCVIWAYSTAGNP